MNNESLSAVLLQQRVRLAVQAARQGAQVKFRINQDGRIVWFAADIPGSQHTLDRAWTRQGAIARLAAIEQEFQQQLLQPS